MSSVQRTVPAVGLACLHRASRGLLLKTHVSNRLLILLSRLEVIKANLERSLAISRQASCWKETKMAIHPPKALGKTAVQSLQTPAMPRTAQRRLSRYLPAPSYRLQRENEKAKPPQMRLYSILALKRAHFIPEDESLAASLLRSFFARWGVVHAAKRRCREPPGSGLCCCPVLPALITTKSPVEKNSGGLQRGH